MIPRPARPGVADWPPVGALQRTLPRVTTALATGAVHSAVRGAGDTIGRMLPRATRQNDARQADARQADGKTRLPDDQTMDALLRSEERLRRALDAMDDGILVFDGHRQVVLCNAAAERMVGIPRAQLLGALFGDLAVRAGLQRPSANPVAKRRILAAFASGHALPPAEIVLHRPDGSEVRVLVGVRPLHAHRLANGFVVSLRQATCEQPLSQQRVFQLADLQAAAQAAARAPSAGAAAEALLAQFAHTWPVVAAAIYLFDAAATQRLAVWLPQDVPGLPTPLVPPERADELQALASRGPRRTELRSLPGSPNVRTVLADRGARSLIVLPLVDGTTLVGALLAGSRMPPDPLSAREDEHLRAVGGLAAGIVRRAVEDEEAARQRERERVARVLATPALLVPHFQPILSIAERRVVGYEALARFRSEPSQPPNAWFAQADGVGLGAELQALAIERARTVARRARLPGGVFLSVNVSPRHLASAPVQRALAGASLRRLVIEVTEEEAVADYVALRNAMAPYLARGARTAVDDAGAGYASMRHVTELRPDFVKLDAELIRGLRDDTARQALMQALVGFTAAIGATAIAEGVEAQDDLALLARIHQPLLAQGYAIAQPGPAWPPIQPLARMPLAVHALGVSPQLELGLVRS